MNDDEWKDLAGQSVTFTNAGRGDSDATYAPYFGQKATVVRSVLVPEKNFDEEVLPMYLLRFADGYETYAWPDEMVLEAPDISSLTNEELSQARIDCLNTAQGLFDDIWTGFVPQSLGQAIDAVVENLRHVEKIVAEIARREAST